MIPSQSELELATSRLKDQMLIVMMKRLLNNQIGVLEFPVAEVDDTGQWTCLLKMDHDRRTFVFQLNKKS